MRSLINFDLKPFPYFILLSCLIVCGAIQGADWPTYQGDNARRGISPESLSLPLREAWTFQSTHPPQPAWQGEAKRDPYNKVNNLKHRQLFDHAFHVVAVENRVLFGSSADDKIYCLNHETGQIIWTHYTEGPVRLAPTVAGSMVYAGSDDGHVYCLRLSDGGLVWKTQLGPRDYRIPGNGRIISSWPIRSGIIVRDGHVYAGAGVFPSQGVFITALDAGTGKLRWRQEQNDLPAQGYMLASSSRLYIPSGRNNPVVCDLADGSRLRVVSGAGGTYALLTGDMLVFGPGKTGQLGVVEPSQKDQLASFAGNHMIIQNDYSYLHTDTQISALNRTRYLDLVRQKRVITTRQNSLKKQLETLTKKGAPSGQSDPVKKQLVQGGIQIDELTRKMQTCFLWKKPCAYPWSLILAGTTLWTGGDGTVAGFNSGDGELRWKHPINGRAHGLAAAHGRLYVSTDQGEIHCFVGGVEKQAGEARLRPGKFQMSNAECRIGDIWHLENLTPLQQVSGSKKTWANFRPPSLMAPNHD